MITMRDIAVRAGVSRSTVSFVLNGKHDEMGVNEHTRQRVLRVAGELGYRRNELARAIVTGRMPVFAFLVWMHSLESEVVSRILNGVIDEADTRGYTVQLLRFTDKEGIDIVRRCIELRPSGVLGIYVPHEVLAVLQHETDRFRIPVVVLDSTTPIEGAAHILSNDEDGCDQAIRHLATMGHRRIAMIAGTPVSLSSNLRQRGYRTAMGRLGLPILPGYEEFGHWQSEIIAEVTRGFFALPEPPTALFCADDRTALVASRTLRALGLSVPGDVSIVGFADLGMAFYSDPPMTTIAQPFSDMGRSAVRHLLQRMPEAPRSLTDSNNIDNTDTVIYRELLPTRLIVRESTAPAKSP